MPAGSCAGSSASGSPSLARPRPEAGRARAPDHVRRRVSRGSISRPDRVRRGRPREAPPDRATTTSSSSASRRGARARRRLGQGRARARPRRRGRRDRGRRRPRPAPPRLRAPASRTSGSSSRRATSSSGLPEGHFDVVVLSNVLEHLADASSCCAGSSPPPTPSRILLRVPAARRATGRCPLKAEVGLLVLLGPRPRDRVRPGELSSRAGRGRPRRDRALAQLGRDLGRGRADDEGALGCEAERALAAGGRALGAAARGTTRPRAYASSTARPRARRRGRRSPAAPRSSSASRAASRTTRPTSRCSTSARRGCRGTWRPLLRLARRRRRAGRGQPERRRLPGLGGRRHGGFNRPAPRAARPPITSSTRASSASARPTSSSGEPRGAWEVLYNAVDVEHFTPGAVCPRRRPGAAPRR